MEHALPTQADLEADRQLRGFLSEGESALRDGRLVEPARRSAAFYFGQALELQAGNAEALAGLEAVQAALLERARQAAMELDFDKAMSLLDAAAGAHDGRDRVLQTQAEIVEIQRASLEAIEQRILELLAAGEFNRAEIMLIDLIALGAESGEVADWRARIDRARVYGTTEPGQVIRDEIPAIDAQAPALVVVPAGSFLMGAAAGDPEATDDQKPQHRVTLSRGFALGRTEVTVAEFRQFIEATGYRTQAERDGRSTIYDERTGRLTEREGIDWRHDYAGSRAGSALPVVHVSWHDAHAYAAWLAQATGKPYRLPSEAEFEYALRAGSATGYWWGEGTPPAPLENLTGDGDASPRNRNWSVAFKDYSDGHWGPAPAGSLQPNPFGLHDLAGNVSEWVMDCWHASYVRAPVDGSAWVNPGCDRRVVRGGYWASTPAQARSAARLYAAAGLCGPRAGFRVARDL